MKSALSYSYYVQIVRHLCFCVITVLCGILFTATSHALAKEPVQLRIGTPELKPYGWKDADGTKHGIVYEHHENIARRTGLTHSNVILPFARMIRMIESGSLDMVTAQPHKSIMAVADQLMETNSINVVLATAKNSNIQTVEDVDGKTLLYITNASYPSLYNIPHNVVEVSNYETMLKIVHSRADISGGVFSEPAFYYWMEQAGLSPDDFGKVILLSTRYDSIFVNKNMPEDTRRRIEAAVEAIFEENGCRSIFIPSNPQ